MIVCLCELIVPRQLNHRDLLHKLHVRSLQHSNKTERVNTLAEQDASISKDARDLAALTYDVVVSVGCFDLFHEGHVILMKRMREHGRKLVVGLHDDESGEWAARARVCVCILCVVLMRCPTQ